MNRHQDTQKEVNIHSFMSRFLPTSPCSRTTSWMSCDSFHNGIIRISAAGCSQSRKRRVDARKSLRASKQTSWDLFPTNFPFCLTRRVNRVLIKEMVPEKKKKKKKKLNSLGVWRANLLFDYFREIGSAEEENNKFRLTSSKIVECRRCSSCLV